jgi:hypothetical protein
VTRSWDEAPTGLAALDAEGTVVEANRTLAGWLGRGDVAGARLPDLLTVGGRIFWETHLFPLLRVEGRLDEVALELRCADGRLPVLLSAVADDDGSSRVALANAGERSRFERELVAARAAAERSEQRLRALQATTAALSGAVTVDGVVTALLDAAVGPLGGGAASMWLVDEAATLLPAGSRGEPDGAVPLPAVEGRFHARADGRVVVPLPGATAIRGVLSVAPRGDVGADPLDVDALTAVGQQGGLALDRARLHEQSATVARELQHALLAGDPPEDPRFAVAAAYRPGVESLEVGGDFHDTFLVGNDVVAVVVGDVVGRGLAAASAMGQLRSAVRAVAGEGSSPAALLRRLDRFVDQVEAASLATLAYAELHLPTGELRWSCAGHPPPALLPAADAPELLWEGRSTPLGTLPWAAPRTEASRVLAPGDRVLLYTDGLFERRRRPLDDGLALVLDTAGRLAGAPLTAAVTGLTDTLLADEEGRDDVCVLLLEWSGGRTEELP